MTGVAYYAVLLPYGCSDLNSTMIKMLTRISHKAVITPT